jgi:hypothetical protein
LTIAWPGGDKLPPPAGTTPEKYPFFGLIVQAERLSQFTAGPILLRRTRQVSIDFSGVS